MDFSHLNYSRSEPPFADLELDYPVPTPLPEYQHQPHTTMSDAIEEGSFLEHSNMHVPRSMMSEDLEDVDGESKPRLTQAQITTLEEEFSAQAKPRTEYKKNLADHLRLDLQRVNVSVINLSTKHLNQ